MRILAFDPGETTGFSVIDSEAFVLLHSGEIKLWLNEPLEAVSWDKLAFLFKHWKPEIVIYETFSLFPWTARAFSWSTFGTIQVIGVIRYLAFENDMTIVGKPPAYRKKGSRIPFSGGAPHGEHARDAARLGLAYAKDLHTIRSGDY